MRWRRVSGRFFVYINADHFTFGEMIE